MYNPYACKECGRVRGHKRTCGYYGFKDVEPRVTLPPSVLPHVNNDTPQARERAVFYMPIPNTSDDGIYVSPAILSDLLSANRHNPAAIQYLADMLGG